MKEILFTKKLFYVSMISNAVLYRIPLRKYVLKVFHGLFCTLKLFIFIFHLDCSDSRAHSFKNISYFDTL